MGSFEHQGLFKKKDMDRSINLALALAYISAQFLRYFNILGSPMHNVDDFKNTLPNVISCLTLKSDQGAQL